MDRYKVELDGNGFKDHLGKWDIEEQRAARLKKEQEEAKEKEAESASGSLSYKLLNFGSEDNAEPS